jgi:hypothetical protein
MFEKTGIELRRGQREEARIVCVRVPVVFERMDCCRGLVSLGRRRSGSRNLGRKFWKGQLVETEEGTDAVV